MYVCAKRQKEKTQKSVADEDIFQQIWGRLSVTYRNEGWGRGEYRAGQISVTKVKVQRY